MNAELWSRNSFEKHYIPEWPCPVCGKKLEFNNEHFKQFETEESKDQRIRGDFYPEDIRYLFHGILRCSDLNCLETVIYSGTGGVESRIEANDDTGEEGLVYFDFFTPKYFIPALHLFKLQSKCPQLVRAEITAAFNLFWCDYSGCANRIRTVVERILDDLKVDLQKEGEKHKSVHSRLSILKKDEPEIAEHLIAIKWIGNAGSHSTEIMRQDLIDGFIILDHCLEKLYYDKERQIKALTKEINKKSGPRSKT